MTERDEEILALHRQVAAERLRADQGWERAEAKSRECLALRDRMAYLGPVRDDQIQNAWLDRAAKLCDMKYEKRAASGHPREASTARALSEEIRALKIGQTAKETSHVPT